MRLFLTAPLVMGYVLVSLAAPVDQRRQTLSHLGERRVNPRRTGFSDVVTSASFPPDSSTRLMKRVPADSESGAPKTPPSRVSLSSRKVQVEIAKAKQNVVKDANTQLNNLRQKALRHRESLGADASEEDIQLLRTRYGNQATDIAKNAKDSYTGAATAVAEKYLPHSGKDPEGFQKWAQEHREARQTAVKDWPGLERDTDVFGDRPVSSGHVGTEFPRTQAEYEIHRRLLGSRKSSGVRPSSSGTDSDREAGKIHGQPTKGQSQPLSGKKIGPGTETGPKIEGGPVDLGGDLKLPKKL